MQIYIADLDAYNSEYLKGEWIELPTEKEEIQEVILRQSKNGQSDFAIHDFELPFEIGEYTDAQTLKNYLDNVYTIEASNNNEFAQNYMYEFYEELLENMPWELSYSIDYKTVFKKLQMTMSITKNPDNEIFYYSNS